MPDHPAVKDPLSVITSILQLVDTSLKAVNNVRRAAYERENLLQELHDIKEKIERIRAALPRQHEAATPTTPQGKAALKQLQARLEWVEQQLETLAKQAAPGDDETKKTGTGSRCGVFLRRLVCCVSKYAVAAKDAALPPTYLADLQTVKAKLQEAYDTAKSDGALCLAQQLQRALPRLYIPHLGLRKQVMEQLCPAADGSQGVRGVLILGNRGMGKSTLATDVALTLKQDPNTPFPDGVFEAYFGPSQKDGQSSSTANDTAAIITTQQQRLLKKLMGAEGKKDDDVDTQLGNALSGKCCLLVLDDVRSKDVIGSFTFDGFEGALLVTGLSRDVWPDAPAEVEITQEAVEAVLPGDEAGSRTTSHAMRVLASRATNDVNAVTVPPGCEAAAQQLVSICEGSIVALVVVGQYLWTSKKSASPAAWQGAVQALESILQRYTAAHYRTDRSPFGAFELGLQAINSDDSRAAFLALELFRPGVPLPLKLVRLAVEVVTGTTYPQLNELEVILQEAVSQGLLVWDQEHQCCKLLDLVTRFLHCSPAATYPGGQRASERLFNRPSGDAPFTAQPSRQLLAAFLLSFGKAAVLEPAQGHLQLRCDTRATALELNHSYDEVRFATNMASSPSESQSPHHVATVILAYRAKDSLQRDDYQAAVKDLDRADQLKPDAAGILLLRGYVRYKMDKFEEALPDLCRADQLEPDNAFNICLLGAVKYGLHMHEDALRDLNRADQLEPDDAFTLRKRGGVQFKLGRIDAALRDLDYADTLEPDRAETLATRGAVKATLGRYEEALQDLERAKQLQPDYALALCCAGMVKHDLHRYEEALLDLDRADQLEPDYTDILQCRGKVKAQLDRLEEALQDFNRADQLKPDDADTLANRGAVKLRLGRYEEAWQDLDRANHLEPNDAFTLEMLQRVQRSLRKNGGLLDNHDCAAAL